LNGQLKNYEEKTMKANERYKLMTRKQRKVAIAKDVIKQVNAGVFDAKSQHGYVVPMNGYLNGPVEQRNAIAVAKECHVCARGALMLSRIAKFNDMVINPICGNIEQEQTAKALEDAFTSRELYEIERAFEGGEDGSDYRRFFLDHKNSNNRLIAICQNIIDHKGTFRPEVRYVVKYVK
jgi:hypothetical protein